MSFPATPIDERGEVIDTGRTRLWCAQEGEGPPLVMLGGFTAGHYVFDLVWPRLRSRNRLVTLEPRGLGASVREDDASEPYTVDVWAQDLHDLLGVLDVEKANIWAQGFSTYYAIRFAARWPDRVGALVTYTDVWAGDPGKRYQAIWAVYRTIVEHFGTKGFGARMLAGLFDVSSPSWFYAWEQRNIETILHADTVSSTVGYCLTIADVRVDLPEVRAPVLVLQGDGRWGGDARGEQGDASLRVMRESLDRLEVVSVVDSHPGYVLIQRPGVCARSVQDFLDHAPESA